ncbi:MAG: TonB-dependent receptor [Bacteroidetes bacterium]|nr:MAG: TonB-dependent receptor [Bacteroidota bacterium]
MKKKLQNLIPLSKPGIKKVLLTMKLSLIIVFLSVLQVSANVYSQITVNLDVQNKSIREVLKTIEQQSQVRFFFSDDLLVMNDRIDVKADNKNIISVLDDIFLESPLTYKAYENNLIVIVPRQLLQQLKITGTVTDKDGTPLPGVNVVVTGTTQGTITDITGKYSIEVLQGSKSLTFSFVGMEPQEIAIGTLTKIDITMVELAVGLEEVVVVGYGTQQKRTISGSITSVTEKSFNTGVTRTAVDLLQGKVAGLVITTASGDVTSQQSMRLRGTSSLTGSSEPFVVVDGVPGMDLNSVAPQDIESISILKDASAAAIYGSRSASGVILITTKKGKANQTTVDYNGYLAFDNVTNKPDVLTAAEWRKYTTDNGMNTTGMDLGGNTDWFNEIMRTGVTQNHDLSFSGGGNKNSYRASVSYLDQQGVVKDNYMQRLNTKLALTQKALKDRLDISLIGAMNQREYQPADTRNFVLAYNMLPIYPVKLADGIWYDNQEFDQGNPVRNIEYNTNEYRVNLFYVNLKADLRILKNLTAGINVYKERGTTDRSVYQDSQTERGRSATGFAQRSFSSSDRKLLETTINYTGKISNHNYSLLGGYSYEDNFSKGANAQNRLFVTNLFTYNNLSAAEKLLPGDASSWANMNRLISFFGRLNYSFSDRYILSAIMRRDGSSKFGTNHKWGTFPSISVAWRLSDETFMQSFSGVLDELKIRVGYGISGNQDGISPYQSLQLYGSSGIYYDDGSWHTSYAVSQNANPDLRWEKTSMSNVGVDYSVFDGRINGTIEYYDKRTSDLLYTYQVPVPPYLYSSMLANVGSMKNAGIEFIVNGDIVRKNNLRWNVSLNFAHNENTITSLSNADFTTSAIKTGSAFIRGAAATTTHIIEEGRSVGTFYGWRCLGIDENGLYILDDMIDGVAGLTGADRTYIGNAQSKLTYGINSLFTYKSFEFSFFMRGVYGNDVLNYSKMSFGTTLWLPGSNVLHDALTNGIKDNTKYNSYYIEKASFLRMENMNLSYSIKPNVLGINLVRLYVTAHNLFTLTKYTGVDPEVSMSGLDPGVEGREYYPKSRTFLLGINMSF